MSDALQIAICDDREDDRTLLRRLTQKWAARSGWSVQIGEFSSAEAFLFSYEDKSDYDILLLDVEMGPMNGVALAKAVRARNETVQIVFVTGYSDYIGEGYEVSALHYLLKPVQEAPFFAVLSRAVDRLQKTERVLTLQTPDAVARVPLRQIDYIDVRLNYATVHAGSAYTVKKPLSELQKELDGRFYRAGRSLIVNLYRVARVSRTEIVLLNGTVLPLPRGAYEGLNRAIIALE